MASTGRNVTADTLTVAPDVLGRTLAEPWRRLAGMLVDLAIVGALSFLSRSILAIGTGAMLCVLLGNSSTAPAALRFFRWIYRALGVLLIVSGILALGHTTVLRNDRLHLDALAGYEESAAMKKTVALDPSASSSEVRTANARLQEQVGALKAEIRAQHSVEESWTTQARAFSRALGVTFGWSGLYFTLLAGITNGRTVGKFMVGTRAVRINGARLTFLDAFIRHGGYVAGVAMGLIGFLKLLWEPNRQAVEDRIAGTVVIRT